MRSKLFSRDFTLVVIGQIISLFGNATVRFALPLYLLEQTASSSLYGSVTALAFFPSILLSPFGGMIADRFNKRNIMVLLDFGTAVLLGVCALLLGHADLVTLLSITLMLLYGIAGAYQPSVQASIPLLVPSECYLQANSVINTVSSFSALLGPALGGVLYGLYGPMPLLWLCSLCFTASAVMEIFIHIPQNHPPKVHGLWNTIRSDLASSLRFIVRDKPAIGQALAIICAINLFLSSMLSVGLPYIITQRLELGGMSSTLYGFTEGALAAGGLIGGVCAGIFAKRLRPQSTGTLLIACSVCVFPMAFSLCSFVPALCTYAVLTLFCFGISFFSTLLTVQILSYIQSETPEMLLGKVLSVVFTLSMCAQPLGTALYGSLFEFCNGDGVSCFSAVRPSLSWDSAMVPTDFPTADTAIIPCFL